MSLFSYFNYFYRMDYWRNWQDEGLPLLSLSGRAPGGRLLPLPLLRPREMHGLWSGPDPEDCDKVYALTSLLDRNNLLLGIIILTTANSAESAAQSVGTLGRTGGPAWRWPTGWARCIITLYNFIALLPPGLGPQSSLSSVVGPVVPGNNLSYILMSLIFFFYSFPTTEARASHRRAHHLWLAADCPPSPPDHLWPPLTDPDGLRIVVFIFLLNLHIIVDLFCFLIVQWNIL